jgi:hypothetical protein
MHVKLIESNHDMQDNLVNGAKGICKHYKKHKVNIV